MAPWPGTPRHAALQKQSPHSLAPATTQTERADFDVSPLLPSWPLRWALRGISNHPERPWLPDRLSLTTMPSTWYEPARGGGVLLRMTSHTRIRMNHAVYSDTPQRAALSRRLSASAMHSANAIHVAGGSFD